MERENRDSSETAEVSSFARLSNEQVKEHGGDITKLVDALRSARSILVITGAGLSADSGLPTYRGVGGLYQDQDTEDGMPIEVALSGSVFRQTPALTWKYLSQVERATRDATYNRGHAVLSEWESRFDRVWVLTQNIDGFHTAAGSQNVIEIHGNLRRLHCTSCSHHLSVRDFGSLTIPPVCEKCGQMMRPAVVLFEEALPEPALSELDRQMRTPFDVAISIGTSSHFPYIVQPMIFAKQTGACTVEINPGTTTLSNLVDIQFPLRAAALLNEVAERLDQADE